MLSSTSSSAMKINEDVERYFKYDMLKLLRIVLAYESSEVE
jgi:hypothetical protein